MVQRLVRQSHTHTVMACRIEEEVVIIDKPKDWRASAALLAENAVAAADTQAMQAAAQSTLLELLSNPAVQPASLSRFLSAFSVPESMPQKQRLLLAKQCWEHLLDTPDHQRDGTAESALYGKMDLLRRTKLYCPKELFRQHCHLEQLQLLVEALESQIRAGIFLCQLRRSLSADGQHSFRPESSKVQQLQNKLETADLLMVVHTLGAGNVLSIDAQQLQQLKLVHLARHGPVTELESMLRMLGSPQQEGSSAATHAQRVCDLLDTLHQGFPILFQPLIECHAGWLDRLHVLLRAGADAAAVYKPWSSSALHMLFYRKSRKVAETTQVQAIQLLLQHGAKAVLNLTDKHAQQDGQGAGSSTPTQRTALLQAASAGRLQACHALLTAGADADVVDSCNQSMLDYLFYLKHSNVGAHRRATAAYTCMQLYGMVNQFRLHTLVSDELEQDCRSCGRCRFLLASCSNRHDDEEEPASSQSEDSSSQEDGPAESRVDDEAAQAPSTPANANTWAKAMIVD